MPPIYCKSCGEDAVPGLDSCPFCNNSYIREAPMPVIEELPVDPTIIEEPKKPAPRKNAPKVKK